MIGELLSQYHRINYLEVSAKNDYQIDKIFEVIINSHQPNIHQTKPPSNISLSNSKPIINSGVIGPAIPAINALINAPNAQRLSQFRSLGQLLHDRG